MIHLKGALLSSYENTYERAMLFLTANHVQVAQPVVEKLQTELNPHKATGPVNIPTRFLMECAKDISRALPLVFQVSLHQGTMPDDWKKSMVTSIFKKGDRSSAINYRPFSLTSVCSKIMKYILYTQIMHHVAKFDILHDSQHGFRKKRS